MSAAEHERLDPLPGDHASYLCITLSPDDVPLSRAEQQAIGGVAMERGYTNDVRVYDDGLFPDRPSYTVEMLDERRELPAERVEEALRIQGREPDTVVTYRI